MIPAGFRPIYLDPADVPVCTGPAHPRPIHCTTQTAAGEWYCRHCEPERANGNKERTLRIVALANEIRRRPYSRRQQNDAE